MDKPVNLQMRNVFKPTHLLHKRDKQNNFSASNWTKVSRKQKTSRRGSTSPIFLALTNIQKLDGKMINDMMSGLEICLDNLRSGNGDHADLREFDSAIMAARIIEKNGVVRGLSQEILLADNSIMSIRLRASSNSGKIGTPFDYELSALMHLITCHRYQLEQITNHEYTKVLRSHNGSSGGKI